MSKNNSKNINKNCLENFVLKVCLHKMTITEYNLWVICFEENETGEHKLCECNQQLKYNLNY